MRTFSSSFQVWRVWLADGLVGCSVQGDHYKVIREIGAASTVLLKNTNDTLPLSVDKIKRTYP